MLITVEESLAEHFRSHGAKVTVVGNYPDLEALLPLDTGITRQKIGIPNNAYIVAYIGGFTLARAILPLIYVTDLLPDITILIAGDGPQRKVIEEAIAGRKNIYYLGWIHHNLVPAYMNLSDVIYYGLKIDDGNSRYSAPNALFNSMAVGKPILTTDIGDISRIVKNEKCGVVVPDSSPENLAYGLKLLRDSYLREKYGENSKKAAIEKYNWEIAKKNLLEVYSKLL
jgi:glycosyltransferase involved in cell wall biosynthesis